MAAGKSNGGSRPTGSRARSVGAAGNMHPNGGVLDDQADVLAMRKQRFRAWADGHTKAKLKENPWIAMYRNDSRPVR